jgi:hypothetical protein
MDVRFAPASPDWEQFRLMELEQSDSSIHDYTTSQKVHIALSQPVKPIWLCFSI